MRNRFEEKIKEILEKGGFFFYKEKKIPVHSPEGLRCKYCNKDLRIQRLYRRVLGEKYQVFGCSCKKKSNESCFRSIFGESEIWINTTKNVKRPHYELWLKRYGEVVAKKKMEVLLKRCNQSLKGFIERYGEKEGLLRFETFKKKSNTSKENFIKRYGEEEGERRYESKSLKMRKNGAFSLGYYLKKNDGNYEEAHKEWIKNQTHNKEWYVKKYGKEKGEVRYLEVCKNHAYHNSEERYIRELGEVEGVKFWKDLVRRKCNHTGVTFSKIASTLFFKLKEELLNENLTLFFDPYNYEFKVSLNKKTHYIDFFIKELNFGIEFYGDFWHANPKIFKEDFFHPTLKITAKQIWDRDDKRIQSIKESNIDIVVIWEKDFRENASEVIKNILNLIKIKNEKNN